MHKDDVLQGCQGHWWVASPKAPLFIEIRALTLQRTLMLSQSHKSEDESRSLRVKKQSTVMVNYPIY